MSAAAAPAPDPGGSASPVDRGSSSSQDVLGGEAGNHDATHEVEEVASGGVPVIQPALVYSEQGGSVELDDKVVGAVDGFRVPVGFSRKDSRGRLYIESVLRKDGHKEQRPLLLGSLSVPQEQEGYSVQNRDRIKRQHPTSRSLL